MSLFKQLSELLHSDESSISVKLHKGDNGTMKVFVTSSMGAIPDNANAALETAYHALSTPFVIIGLPEDIEVELQNRLANYTVATREAVDCISSMKALLDHAKAKQKQIPTVKNKSAVGTNTEKMEEEEDDESTSTPPTPAKSIFDGEAEKDF